MPVSPVNANVSESNATASVPLSPEILRFVATEAVDIVSTIPFAFTVTTGIAVAEPNVPAETPESSR